MYPTTTSPCRHTFDLSRIAERLATCTHCGYVERAALPPRGETGKIHGKVRVESPKGRKGPSGQRQKEEV